MVMHAHILVIDDEASVRDTLVRSIQRAGYRVSQAADGECAITMLTGDDDATCYDLVISDIVMGEVDGVQVLHVARSLPDAPEVILLTGHGTLETAIAAVRAGAFDYLLKPYRIDRLLERVATALEQRQQRRRQLQKVQSFEHISQVIRDASQKPSLIASTAACVEPEDGMPGANEARRYIEIGELRIDRYRHQVQFQQQAVHMTPTEYKLILCLAEQRGRVVTFSDLTRYTHNQELSDTDAHELLSWHVRNLRQKIDRRYLVSVRGTGYLLIDPEHPPHPDMEHS